MTSILLRPSVLSDLPSVSSWLQNQNECDLWSGGVVPFPIHIDSLSTKIVWDSVQSWTVTDNGKVVGYGQLVPKPEGRLHLARILIDPSARGNGFGRLLVTHLLNEAITNQASKISLNVHPENKLAKALYLSLGFRPVENYEASNRGAFVYM